jgi:hypothetical protein
MQSFEGMSADVRSCARRSRTVSAAVLVAALALVASAAPAQQSGAGRFKLSPRSGPITAHRLPLSLLAKERIKVVVTMNVESVAQVRARTPGHVISSQDHESIHTQIARQHASLEPTIARALSRCDERHQG